MKPFDYYVEEGKVKVQSRNANLAVSLRIDSDERAKKVLQLDASVYSKIVFENIYDSLRCLLDALLSEDGFKSYSHEASIAYLSKFGVEIPVLQQLDHFRIVRNNSKYYGKEVLVDETLAIISFYKNYKKILSGSKR